MAWTRARQHRLNAITLIVLMMFFGMFVVTSVVMASGILPIPRAWLQLGGAAIGAVASIPAMRFGTTRWRFVAWSVLAVIVVLFGASRLFLYFQETGLEHAKRYGEQWAHVIASAHQTSGRWPSSLQDAARHAPPPALRLPSPYLASCSKGVCDKVGGYFIAYLPEQTPPELRVARRDIRLVWDWTSKRWRKVTRQ